ncbi:hypothetical protein WJX74_009336 [Apatococcus lobatus]|uniref:Uncharacterized protein n=1 Tax=Apatococcus lobatus TaxID=904363 RepID=A0AAW1RTA4_9CHLO
MQANTLTPNGNQTTNFIQNNPFLATLPNGGNGQGLLHFSFNDNCEEAAFLANFGTRDPGTQSIWNSIMQVPSSILQLSTGIPETNFNSYKQLPLILAPGTGGEECLKRCGLDFQKVNKPLPNAYNPTARWTTATPATSM